MLRHSVIILHGEKTEVFRDVKTFVRTKGLAYQTWIQKEYPTHYNGFVLEKIKGAEIFDSIEINGEIIKIQ
jgi:hypothetical protein